MNGVSSRLDAGTIGKTAVIGFRERNGRTKAMVLKSRRRYVHS